MCEQFVARSPNPFRLAQLWPFADRLERYGISGFGWGLAWTSEGGLRHHVTTHAFRDDPEVASLGAVETDAVLVHLRRPSKLSTLTLEDAQPFLDPAGRFAFSHNGDLRQVRTHRARYQAQGRIHGRADTEVGQRWLEDAWREDGAVAQRFAELHRTFGGQANLAVLTPDGTSHVYAGNTENPVFAFSLGAVSVVSTGIYSIDRSLFQLVVPEATGRRLVRNGQTVALDAGGELRILESAPRSAA
jgi:glutamine phosphoribosylpyrophosphate amidotransferase